MKYEIINPSDLCYMTSDSEKVAIAACLFFSQGNYGLKDESDSTVCPILRFYDEAGTDEFLTETYGSAKSFSEFIGINYAPMADALESVSLPSERTSMNEIQERAIRTAKELRKMQAAALGTMKGLE
jgi:hypothetical protein